MRVLGSGIDRFQAEVYPRLEKHFHTLAEGQSPPVLFVTCSDSRIDPSLITQTLPGELFVLRNAGNMVPAYDQGDLSSASAVEFAVTGLKVQHIVVCGHSSCGAMAALVAPEPPATLPTIVRWLEYASPTARHVSALGLEGTHATDAAIEHNVRQQLANLLTHPSVRDAVAAGKLFLHGWVYEIRSGRVQELDDTPQQR